VAARLTGELLEMNWTPFAGPRMVGFKV